MIKQALESYREVLVQGASPVGLVVMLYDSALRSIYRAIKAIGGGDIRERTADLNHALDVISQLQGSLDVERGGETAHILSSFYAHARNRIFAASIENSEAPLVELAKQVASIRDAWQQVDLSASRQ